MFLPEKLINENEMKLNEWTPKTDRPTLLKLKCWINIFKSSVSDNLTFKSVELTLIKLYLTWLRVNSTLSLSWI